MGTGAEHKLNGIRHELKHLIKDIEYYIGEEE